jgi:hypothetical protein
MVVAILLGLTDGQGNEQSNLQELILLCPGKSKSSAYWTALSNCTHSTTLLYAVSIPGESESKLVSSFGFCNKQVGEQVGSLLIKTNDRGSKLLLPTLLELTKQVSKTQTCTLFACLLETCESIRPIL